jgi:hypothetical protein
LLLIHQLPSKPAYLRVKVWRRLQALGAVGVKNAVYALPASEQAQEDFEWLLREITGAGGEAMVVEARLVDGLTDHEVRGLFDQARDADYAQIESDAKAILSALKRRKTLDADKRAEMTEQVTKLRAARDRVAAIDFFGAHGRERVDALLGDLDRLLAPPVQGKAKSAGTDTSALRARIWVTRTGVHVDRIASAWLIRRFIDPDATFKFVPGKGYVPEPGELRFDMFEAEFTHEGDLCTFEVLLKRQRLTDPALQAIGEIVHDIDLKDAKFGRAEASGIAQLIAGIARSSETDEERIARGSAIFEDLYTSFRRKARS